jgi:hypothetical protein
MFPAGLSAIQISAGLGDFSARPCSDGSVPPTSGNESDAFEFSDEAVSVGSYAGFRLTEPPAPCLRPLKRAMSLMPPAIILCPHRSLRPVNISMKSIPPLVDSDAKRNALGRSGSPRKDWIFLPSPPPSAAFRDAKAAP